MQTFNEWYLETYYPQIDLDRLRRISENLNESQETELDEGLIGKVLGTIGGAFLGPKIGRIICKTLGIEKGLLFNFLTSAAVGAALGYNWGKD